MDFTPLFKPKTMAVVGVSLSNDRHPANVIYNKIHLRYPIKVYPINPKGGILQQDRVYRSIAELPQPVDLVVVAVRATHVPTVIEECIREKAGAATIISGGFAERGRKDLQHKIRDMARAANFPIIGPNCLGIYAPGAVDTFFLPSERLIRPEAGNVAIVSQSGGVLVDQMVKFAGEGIGVSLAVSIGNKALIRELDLLQYLADDPGTRVITFYVEGFAANEGREFVQAAAKCPKPVIVLKAGKSAAGSRAVSSHTASLAGDYRVFSSVLAQHGIVEAHNEFELLAYSESLSCYQSGIEGNVGIITVSGGHGALAVDACDQRKLHVPDLPMDARETIRESLSASIREIAALGNPLDMTGSASDDDFVAATNRLCQLPQIDSVLMLMLPYSPGVTADLGARLSYVYQQLRKPLIAYVPNEEKYRMLIEGFELNRVPVASSIDAAVLMVDALRRLRPC